MIDSERSTEVAGLDGGDGDELESFILSATAVNARLEPDPVPMEPLGE